MSQRAVNSTEWIGARQAILSAVFLSYLINFTMQWMARETREEKISSRVREIHFKVLVFGITALVACNLLQCGIFEALFAYLIFGVIALLHYLNFQDTDAKKRAIVNCVFYALVFLWLVGTLVHYSVRTKTNTLF